MVKIQAGEVTLLAEIEDNKITITGFEGAGVDLNIPETFEVGGKNLPVSKIDRKAFFNSSFKEVSLPGTLEEIGDWAFSKCIHLKKLVIRTMNGRGNVDVSAENQSLSTSGMEVFNGNTSDMSYLTDIVNNVHEPSIHAVLTRFGKGILEGATAIEEICIGYEEPDDLAYLLATVVSKLPAPFLLRTENLGSEEWYDSFDLSLDSFLKESDMGGYSERVLCGEEDISYDGIGSVDGELLGETEAFVRDKRKQKAGLCMLRLLHDTGLSDGYREVFRDYIKEHSLGKPDESAWLMLKDSFGNNVKLVELYCEIVKPDRVTVGKMLSGLGKSNPETKSFLIEYKPVEDGDDFFADLIL